MSENPNSYDLHPAIPAPEASTNIGVVKSSKGNWTVLPLAKEHLPDAAGLFRKNYRTARQRQPLLPPRHEDSEAVPQMLSKLAFKAPGVVAIRDGQVVGYLLGQVLREFRGKPTVYVPEWAHAAVAQGRQEVYHAMYASLSSSWVAQGCLSHLVTTFADDSEAISAFVWNEFGMTAVDTLRGVDSVEVRATGIDIRKALSADAHAVLSLTISLQRHLAAAPVFKADSDVVSRETIERKLSDPNAATWVAWHDGEPVAYMDVHPANQSAAWVTNDPKTASIKAAFTHESFRGRGIGGALLNRAMEWARSMGYERCAVDFEPQNRPACRFWLRHFRPVCYTLIRHIDQRLAGSPDTGGRMPTV